MDNNANKMDNPATGNDRQIQLVVNNNQEECTIDLGDVFHNMKLSKRIFAWVLVLCVVVGVCAPLLLYQITKAPLTVSSVVTLRYEVPQVKYRKALENREISIDEIDYEPVSDLTAPNG